ncbi:DUF3592 domain-containing protein [Kribbella sp. NPDC026611]|uniref:DUF3592 domain-containing protein n=1 Tax=Kribbella sp. NPDC026611 TaxID=3154911 RepID=UPI0033F3FD7A
MTRRSVKGGMNRRRRPSASHTRGPGNHRKEPGNRGRRWRFDYEGVACIVLSIVFVAIGYFEVHDLYLLEHRGEVVTGTVLDETGGKTPRITVRYTTLAGEQITSETANYFEAKVGQPIQIVYDRAEPTRMQTAEWGFDDWIPGVGFGAVALLMLAIGVAQLRT